MEGLNPLLPVRDSLMNFLQAVYAQFMREILRFLAKVTDGSGNMNELQIGEQLDHYRIEALAAKSGMASIYRAVDCKTVCRWLSRCRISKWKVIRCSSIASNAKMPLADGWIIPV